MIHIRQTTATELSNGHSEFPNAVELGSATRYFTDKAIIELKKKLDDYCSERNLIVDK